VPRPRSRLISQAFNMMEEQTIQGSPPTVEMTQAAAEGHAANGVKKRTTAASQGVRAGKADDPIEAMSDKFCTYINQANAGNLLMIAW
jgi:hypothetical protein